MKFDIMNYSSLGIIVKKLKNKEPLVITFLNTCIHVAY